MNLCLSAIRAKLDLCLQTHPFCGSRSPQLLPTRLVEISFHNEAITARLVPSAQYRAPYLALSYCWGSSHRPEALRTTTINLDDHQRSIDVVQLPNTIQEALTLTWELGYRYVWVDSLCVVQDSPEDWKQESGRRGEVFANALCTIVAPTADAQLAFLSACVTPQADGGVVTTLRSSKLSPALLSEQLGPYQPTSSRAWCLQETEQSLRLLYFRQSSDGTLTPSFTCRTTFLRKLNQDRFQSAIFSPSSEPSELFMPKHYTYWYAIVQEYSRRNLSRESDKLLALATLAASVQKKLSDFYAAGLWRGDFVHGLLWKVTSDAGCDRPSVYVAPSWSWASMKGEVCYPHLEKALSQNLVTPPTLLELSLKMHDSHVLSANATLRGQVKLVICTRRGIFSNLRLWQLIDAKDKVIGQVFADCQDDLIEQASLLCLCIGEVTQTGAGDYVVVAIALQQVDGVARSTRFKRVGYAELHDGSSSDNIESIVDII